MPNRSPRRSRPRLKRRYQWYGGQDTNAVSTVAGTGTTDIIELRPSHLSLDAMREYRLERIILDISVHRTQTALVELLNMAVFMVDTNSSGAPTDVLEIQSNDPFVFANKSLLHMACLSVPACGMHSAGTLKITNQVECHHFDFKPRRKLDLAREAIGMQLNADVTAILKATIQWRLLLSS